MPKCGSPFFIVLFKIQFTIQQQPGNDAEEGSLDQQEEDHASLGEVESLFGVGFEDLAEGVEDAEASGFSASRPKKILLVHFVPSRPAMISSAFRISLVFSCKAESMM
mgnify:CR=1 FL=1